MICPQCEEDGKSSTVEKLFGESTCLGWFVFYDRAGLYHSHDPNRHTRHYRCSNGHEWTEIGKARCPNCSYPEVTE